MECLASQITDSINCCQSKLISCKTFYCNCKLLSSLARVGHGSLERDLSLYDRKAAQFLANVAAEKTKEMEAQAAASDQEINGNPDNGIKRLELNAVDPLDYWGQQVLLSYSLVAFHDADIEYLDSVWRLLHHLARVCTRHLVLSCNLMCFRKDL